MKNDTQGSIRFHTRIRRFFGSKTFLFSCILIFITGFLVFAYTSFKVDVDRQDNLLREIKIAQQETAKNRTVGEDNNKKLIVLQQRVDEQNTVIVKLNKSICTLQKQVIKLGAIPEVQDNACNIADL